ncbi:MAG: prephenate dehydratase [Kiritimatiellae bacterium]|nr:prephenate dehydratase [Kiritimatiellia bacterium]
MTKKKSRLSLNDLRARIDRIDAQLVRLLNRRMRAAIAVGKLKHQSGAEIYVPSREKAVLDHVRKLNAGPLREASLAAVYREIMSACLGLEKNVRVAYLGPASTFTHQAARSRFGASVDYAPCETIDDVFNSVQNQDADYGVVPVENSTEGAVTHTLDRFMNTPLHICAEIFLPVSESLMAKVPRARIRRVYSHPQVFGQCRRWLQREMPGAELVPTASTAKAAELAVADKEAGALASELAAEMHGLRILARNVQDFSSNETRFLVIGKIDSERTGADKTSILFGVKQKPGTLYSALESFKKYRVNLTMIESRPSKEKAWEYLFFVDFEGHVSDARVKNTLADLAEHSTRLTVLGSYPRAARPR